MGSKKIWNGVSSKSENANENTFESSKLNASDLRKLKEASLKRFKELGDTFGENFVKPIKIFAAKNLKEKTENRDNLVVRNKKVIGAGVATLVLGVSIMGVVSLTGSDIGFAGGKDVQEPTPSIVAHYSKPILSGYAIYVDGVPYGFFQNATIANVALEQYKAIYSKPINAESQVTSVSFKQNVAVKEIEKPLSESKSYTSIDEAVKQLQTSKKVALTYKVKKSDSLGKIAKLKNVSVAEIKNQNAKALSKGLKPGKTIRIKVKEPVIDVIANQVVTETAPVKYKIKYEKSKKMYKGTMKVKVKGVNGKNLETANVTLINGEVAQRSLVTAQALSEPVDKVVVKGTRKRPVSRGGGDSGYASGELLRPLSGGFIISGYGYRGSEFHRGIDIAVPSGTTLIAADGGRVVSAEFRGSYGGNVLIDHGNGLKTRYAHMSDLSVRAGQTVSRGETIGFSGATGNATGPHLHFEVIKNGVLVNPTPYVR